MKDLLLIEVSRLRPGMFIHLDIGWMSHPFTLNSFLIKSPGQIETIKKLGLTKVHYSPAKSTVPPLGAQSAPPAAPATPPEPAPEIKAQIETKKLRVAANRQLREQVSVGERAFLKAAGIIRDIHQYMHSDPARAMKGASDLISQTVSALASRRDISLLLMGDSPAGDENYYHSLNVSLLGMMLAKAMEMPDEYIQIVGMGGLLHDIGKSEIPSQITLKKDPLNHAEEELYKTHVRRGVAIGEHMGLPQPILQVIAAHHELLDGSGYPSQLSSNKIPISPRIVCLVNAYDELCNPLDVKKALTPHEALSLLFAKQSKKFDPVALQKLIQMLGAYPPGTVVQLSNDTVGMVMALNPSNSTRPNVMIYDASVPKEEAMSIDLAAEPDISIKRALRPAMLPRQIHEYLSPRHRVTYYFDAKGNMVSQ
jgi:putative nucleotidyltransferase with HDIG domain